MRYQSQHRGEMSERVFFQDEVYCGMLLDGEEEAKRAYHEGRVGVDFYGKASYRPKIVAEEGRAQGEFQVGGGCTLRLGGLGRGCCGTFVQGAEGKTVQG